LDGPQDHEARAQADLGGIDLRRGQRSRQYRQSALHAQRRRRADARHEGSAAAGLEAFQPDQEVRAWAEAVPSAGVSRYPEIGWGPKRLQTFVRPAPARPLVPRSMPLYRARD